MRGKIRRVRWVRIERENKANHYSHDWHPCYESYVVADLYDSPHNRCSSNMYVDITSDVLNYYNGSRITRNRVDEMDELLRNVWIDYYYDEDDDEDYLDGDIEDYI